MIRWAQIAKDIQEVMPLEQASREVGMCKDFLRNLKYRRQIEPGFRAGLATLKLHARVCGCKKYAEIIRG